MGSENIALTRKKRSILPQVSRLPTAPQFLFPHGDAKRSVCWAEQGGLSRAMCTPLVQTHQDSHCTIRLFIPSLPTDET